MELKKNVKTDIGTYEVELALDAATFNDAVSKVFKKTASKYKIAGFRPGKAPRNLIEQMYGKDVFTYDAVNELFPAAYEDAIKEAGIEPVDRPEVDIVSADAENGVVLTAIVTVKPDVELGEYKGLKATKVVHTV
ncbi:MAG: trigger factor family protein, partial [Pygmaiobacter sp.]